MPKPILDDDNSYFAQANKDWDLEQLLEDIAVINLGKRLEGAFLRNLSAILLGTAPKDAATVLNLTATGLRTNFTEVYRLLEDLTDQPRYTVTYKNAPLVLAKYRKGNLVNTIKSNLLGREKDHIALQNLAKRQKIVLIKASAGIGKSTLALEFLRAQFKKVIRIEMGLESGNVTPAEEKV